MMTNALFGFQPSTPVASGSGFNVKRKSRAWSFDEEEDRQTQARRVKSPTFERRSTWQTPAPELVADNSTSPSGTAGTEDEHGMEGMDVDMDAGGGVGNQMIDQGIEIREQGGCGMSAGYSFGHGGSGGFGFGPGAEEDDEDDIDLSTSKGQFHNTDMYPSLTPHPNPNHYLNSQTPNLNLNPFNRANSPLSAQAFSSSLRGPGVYQPTSAPPLAMDANAVEQARSVHGPQCKSIPKLRLSQYPDAATGKQSMWAWCPDCGSVERTQ